MAEKDIILKVKSDTKQAEQGFAKVKSSLGGIATAMGLAFGAAQIISFGKEAVLLASKVEGVKTAFDKLNDPYLLENLRRATRNTVSDFDLMKQAMVAKNFKIPLDTLTKGLEFAQKVAAQTGQSVDYLTNSFVMGVGRKAPMILDNLTIGIVELNTELKKTKNFSEAVSNVMDQRLKEMGDVALTTADKLAQMTAAWENMKVEIGTGLIPVLTSVYGFFKDIVTAINDFDDKVSVALFGVTALHKQFTGMMISPHRYKEPGSSNDGWIDPRTGGRADKGYSANRGTLDYDTNQIFMKMIDEFRKLIQSQAPRASIGGLLGLREVSAEKNVAIEIPTEQELRTAFREFDVIANESARTLYNVFSEAWDNIFGKANSIFEQLFQNISMGLFDLIAQDFSSSIFNALIPGGNLLGGLFQSQSSGTVLVQIGESAVEKATQRSVQSSYSELERRRIL